MLKEGINIGLRELTMPKFIIKRNVMVKRFQFSEFLGFLCAVLFYYQK